MSDVDFRFFVGVLLAVVAVLFFACIALCVIYLTIAQRLTRQMQKTVRRMEALLDESKSRQKSQLSSVPPMRISVQRVASVGLAKSDAALMNSMDGRLRELSFSGAGDFQIQETCEQLRAFVSNDAKMLAAIRMPAGERLYAEFLLDIGDGRRAGIGNPPVGSLTPDDTSIAKHFQGSLDGNPALLSQMWLEAKEMSDKLECHAIDTTAVAEFFEQSHASEMDWRMAHGGVTEDEVRQAFGEQGITASREDIEAVQLDWQQAIDRHILVSAGTAGSATELLVVHEYSFTELLVVHEYSLAAHLEKRLASYSQEYTGDSTARTAAATSMESCRSLLATMLKLFPARDAIARLRPHLPDSSRYQLLHRVEHPIAADIYRFPA